MGSSFFLLQGGFGECTNLQGRRTLNSSRAISRSVPGGRLLGTYRRTTRLGPSMSRPIPVKSFFCSLHDFFHFSRSAKPPLSPPFHPHSYVSDVRSVQVGCSRFSRRCHLVIVLFLTFWVGIGRRTCRSHLNSAVKLGCSVTNSFPVLESGASAPHS